MNDSASDAAALRREARRRKILENSDRRLKLIEGIGTSQCETETYPTEKKTNSTIHHSDISNNLHFQPETDSKFSELLKENKELKKISEILLQDNTNKLEDEEEEEEEEEGNLAEVVSSKEKLSYGFFFEKKLHYILLACLVNVLFYFDLGYLFYENIFCPFYTVKAIEFISRGREKEDLQPFLFLFLAGLPRNIQKLMKIVINLFSIFLSDLFLYIFTFVIGTKIINIQV